LFASVELNYVDIVLVGNKGADYSNYKFSTADEARCRSRIWCSLWLRKRPSLKLSTPPGSSLLHPFPFLTHHIGMSRKALLFTPTIFKITAFLNLTAKISKFFKVTFQPTARPHLFSSAFFVEPCKPEVDRIPYKEVTAAEDCCCSSMIFSTFCKL
jgi:hypothetical protein